MLDGAQEFHGMAFFLQGIIGGGGTLHGDLRRVDFEGLLGLRGEQQLPGNDEGGPDILAGDLIKVCDLIRFKHDLQIAEIAAVVEFDKAQRLAGAQGTHPAADGNGLLRIAGRFCKQRLEFYSFHGSCLPFCNI